MKFFPTLIGITSAGVLGYLVEPRIRQDLTGVAPSAAEMAKNKQVILQPPGGAAAIKLTELTAAQLPESITIRTAAQVSHPTSGAAIALTPGNRVQLVKVRGGNAVISAGDPLSQGEIPVTDTDLIQQIEAAMTANGTIPAFPRTPISVAPAPPPPVEVAPAPPAPEAAPTPPPAAPEPAPAAAPVVLTPEEVVKLMQDSIRASEVKEIVFAAAGEWKAEADETIDGEAFNVGTLSYKSETILGVKTMQAKALIQGGKIKRWVRPKTGVEIK